MSKLSLSEIIRKKKNLSVIAIQLLILLSSILIWAVNRTNVYQEIYTPDDFILNEDAFLIGEAATDSSHSSAGFFLSTTPQALKAGSYQIVINYSTSQNGSSVSANTSQLGPMEFHCSSTTLTPTNVTAALHAELSRSVDDFNIQVNFSGSGSISISSIIITETGDMYKRMMFYAVLLCLIINFLIYFHRCDPSRQKIILALTGIFLAACYPLYTDYLTAGHDMPFHLLRIEGIAEGLRTKAAVPFKIYPLMAKGYGYATGVFYGDIMLYFPACLRLLGFSVQSAYKFFVAMINLGTVIISYFSFHKIFRSRRLGVLGSLLYTTSLYRLIDTYTRAAVGEYTAMLFLPLVLCGFYLIFTSANSKNWPKYAILISAGLTGVIQSHVLSCEMIAFIILPVCLILIKRIFHRYVFSSLALGAILTALLNAGFLVPFLDYYTNSDLYITSEVWNSGVSNGFQARGIFPIQLFSLFQHSKGGVWDSPSGVYNEMTSGTGVILLIGVILFIYLILFHLKECRDDINFLPACLCCSLGGLLLFMSTCCFPWDAVISLGDVAETLTNTLQFPWRLLAPATVLLTFTTCFALSILPRVVDRGIFLTCLCGGFLLMVINVGWYMYNFAYTGEPYRVYSSSDLNTMALYSYEYLPASTNPDDINENLLIFENISDWSSYQKQNLAIQCHVVTENSEGYIDFPLNYYNYYVCEAVSSKEHLDVSAGHNGMLRVTFPANFRDTVLIRFIEPWFWRLSEGLSLITFLCCGIALFLMRYKRSK